MSETLLVKQIQLALAPLGVRLFRNNCGAYKKGKFFIKYGLCPGSSDLIGIFAGRFVAIEVKVEGGVMSDSQEAFLKMVKDNGGIGFEARSVNDAVARFTL